MSNSNLGQPSPILGIREKLIIIFIAIKVLPLIALAYFATHQVDLLGVTVKQKSEEMVDQTRAVVNQVGKLASESSIRALDLKSREALERLTTDTARAVADFLYERDNDIQLVAHLPMREEELRFFLTSRKKGVLYHSPWVLSADKTHWQPPQEIDTGLNVSASSKENEKDFHYRKPDRLSGIVVQPLYHEVTFVDLNGLEKMKVSATGLLPGELRNVADQAQTWCRAETYFREAQKLKRGEIYVSKVIGPYISSPFVGTYTPARAREAGVAYAPEDAGYAGKENPVGRRFQGIVRWVTPVYRDDTRIGYVTLALDHTHLMEYTDHIMPNNERYSDIADAGAGNYAFMWDYAGRNVSHARDYFIVGYDPKTGEEAVPWLSSELYRLWLNSGQSFSRFEQAAPTFDAQSLAKKPSAELSAKGMYGLDCRYLNFAPQCTGWANLTQFGGSGSFAIFWSNLWKLTTAAAIPYYTGMYGESKRGFGFITIGANVDEFHASATETAGQIQTITTAYENNLASKKTETLGFLDQLMRRTVSNLTISTSIMVVAVIFVAIWMAAILSRKITQIIGGIRIFQQGDLSHRLQVKNQDEIGQLAAAFNEMSDGIERSVAELKQARIRAEESDKAKSLFLANMSHEIRTPMNAILGMTQLALSSCEDEKQKKLLEAVKTSADSLLAVVNDILDFSKIEAGQLDLDNHPFSLSQVIKSTLKSVSVLVNGKDIEIRSEVDDNVPRFISGDQMRLRQVLFNLLGNGVKFTEQGYISLAVRLGKTARETIQLIFVVEDTGIGIAPEHLQLIFDSFSQGDVSIARKHQGTGLGLAISRKLCRMMGGDISVASALGKGSTFTFSICCGLPDEKPMLAEVDEETAGVGNGIALSILLVEDNPTNRDLAQMVLEQHHHQVQTAESGIQALNMLAARQYDVVFMDVQMPEMDGFTTTQIIRGCESGADLLHQIPFALEQRLRKTMAGRHQFIIALTAHAMKGDKEKCVAAGMDDYLTKPFQLDQVIAILDNFSHTLKKENGDDDMNSQQQDSSSLLRAVSRNLCQAYGLEEGKALELLAKTVPVLHESLAQLKSAVENENSEELGKVVHSLRGVLLNMWLKEEAELVELVKENYVQGKKSGAIDLVETLFQKLRELR